MDVHGFLWAVESREAFSRELGRPQLTAIGISGTVGVGIFISSTELFSITGSLGTFLAYLIASSITACVMYTMAEMVAARPVTGAIVDFPNTFVSSELGFAVGTIYFISQALCMATLNASTARVADSFSEFGLDHGTRVGLIFGLVIITALSNLVGVKYYGQLERVVAIFKLALIALLAVLSIGVICGLGGPRNLGNMSTLPNVRLSSNFTTLGLTPGFYPAGFRNLTAFNVDTRNGTLATSYGIPGEHGGRLFALLTAINLAMFSCMGGDQVIMTAGEAKDPWNDLPKVTQLIYGIPLAIYPILSLLVGFTLNYTESNLYRPWAVQQGTGYHSPFIIAIQDASLGALPKVLNTCFLLSAYTCGNTALYVSSRTLFVVCHNYGTPWMKKYLATTSANNTPKKAIIFTSLFGFLGLLGLADKSFNQPVLTMSAFFTGAVGCVYVSECWAFLKFKEGLDALEARKMFSRDHWLYRRYLFRGHSQPFFAYCGMIGTGLVILFSGIPSIWLLCHRHELIPENNIKSMGLIAADLVGAYSGPVLFVLLYFGRRFFCGSEPRDPKRFPITAYVIPNDTVFQRGTALAAAASVDGSTEKMEEYIKQHLEGHGRIIRVDSRGRVHRGRGFWTEASMFIFDRKFPDETGSDGG